MKVSNEKVFGVIILALLLTMLNFVGLFAQKQFEGWWEEETVTETSSKLTGQIKEVEHSKIYYKPGKMKQVNIEENTIEIIRLDLELMWSLDAQAKTYTEISFENAMKSMQAAREQMNEKMKQLSDEDRQMMQQMLGDKFSKMLTQRELPQLSFKITGKSKTINGFKCKQAVLLLDNSPMMELWITDKYYMGDDFLKYYEKTGLLKGKLPKAKELKGFIVSSRMEASTPLGSSVTQTTVTKVVPQKLSDKEFEIPAGYRKIAPQEF